VARRVRPADEDRLLVRVRWLVVEPEAVAVRESHRLVATEDWVAEGVLGWDKESVPALESEAVAVADRVAGSEADVVAVAALVTVNPAAGGGGA